MKYIDSEKLIAEIERLKEQSVKSLTDGEEHAQFEYDVACGYENALIELKSFIESLEKEQPKRKLRKVCNLREDLKADKPLEERLEELRQIRAEKDRLDEAAEEFARTTFTQPYSETPEKEITIIEPDKLVGFKAGAKWMAEQKSLK